MNLSNSIISDHPGTTLQTDGEQTKGVISFIWEIMVMARRYLALLGLLLFSLLAHAQWIQTSGPTQVQNLKTTDSLVLAMTFQGKLYLSSNNGDSWNHLTASTGYFHTAGVVGNTVLAGYYSSGMYMSTDMGSSWIPSDSGMPPNVGIQDILIKDDTAYAGTLHNWSYSGLFRSVDSGKSWMDMGFPSTMDTINSIHKFGHTLFAVTGFGYRTFFTTNEGASWDTLSSLPSNSFVYDLEMCGGMLFAALEGGGVVVSPDTGQTWQNAATGLLSPVPYPYYYLASSGSTIFAGTTVDVWGQPSTSVFFSTNNGSRWFPFSEGLPQYQLNALATSDEFLFTGFFSTAVSRRSVGETQIDGLIAQYPLNGTSDDLSGNSMHGIVGDSVQWVPNRFGIANSACRLDGGSDFVFVPTFLPLDSVFTIAMWLKVDGDFSASWDSVGSFCSLGGSTLSSQRLNFTYAAKSEPGWLLSDNINGDWFTPYDALHEWTFIAIVYNGNEEKLFINGDIFGTRSIVTPLNPENGDTLWLGMVGGSEQPFNGSFDDIRIYLDALPDSTISELYHEDGWYPDPTWELAITVQDVCDSSGSLVFGQAPVATQGLDAVYGELDTPPPPPSGIFDIRFVLPVVPGRSSVRDFRNDSLVTITWRMRLQPQCGYPMVLSWNSSGLPEGSFYLKDEFGGTLVNINMKQESTYTHSNFGLQFLLIEYNASEDFACRNIEVNQGWNMLSIPVKAADMRKTTLLPTAVSNAFRFHAAQGYVVDTLLQPGKAYWVKFASGGSIPVCGLIALDRNVSVTSGWNLVGPFEEIADSIAIVSSPSGIVEAGYFGFEAGYIRQTSLLPGKGYWMRASSAGSLGFPGSSSNRSVYRRR